MNLNELFTKKKITHAHNANQWAILVYSRLVLCRFPLTGSQKPVSAATWRPTHPPAMLQHPLIIRFYKDWRYRAKAQCIVHALCEIDELNENERWIGCKNAFLRIVFFYRGQYSLSAALSVFHDECYGPKNLFFVSDGF